jgi:soluble lytic murein transglycosylase-like protein
MISEMSRKIVVFLLAFTFLAAGRASAELIFFDGDRSMSVKSHRFEGDTIIITLRSGGEMTFSRQIVTRIAPDEVPYDEPQAAPEPTVENNLELELVDAPPALGPIIEAASARHDVPAKLLKAVIQVESAYQPRARSPKGAMGLMQLMPATARQYRTRNPFDPRANIEAGTRYLRSLLDRFELPLALAAYNAGEQAVRRFNGVPPYPETQDYVRKILALLR